MSNKRTEAQCRLIEIDSLLAPLHWRFQPWVSETDSAISAFGHIHCCQICKSLTNCNWQTLSRLILVYTVCKSVSWSTGLKGLMLPLQKDKWPSIWDKGPHCICGEPGIDHWRIQTWLLRGFQCPLTELLNKKNKEAPMGLCNIRRLVQVFARPRVIKYMFSCWVSNNDKYM